MTSHFKHLFHPTTESPLFCTAAVNVLKQKTESMMGTSWHRMEIFDWQGRYSAFGFFLFAFYAFKVNRMVIECVLPPFTVHITFFFFYSSCWFVSILLPVVHLVLFQVCFSTVMAADQNFLWRWKQKTVLRRGRVQNYELKGHKHRKGGDE